MTKLFVSSPGDRPSHEFDQEVKILLIGDTGVGKSSLARRFADEDTPEFTGATIGVDFKVRYIRVTENRKLKVALWDTAGAERFRTLTASYYRGVHAYVMVYDVTDRNSLQSLEYWLKEVEQNATNKEAIKLIIANKIDQLADPCTTDLVAEGRSFAEDHAALFLEASAKTGEGVKFAFDELLLKVVEQPHLLEEGQASAFSLVSKPPQFARLNCLC